MNALEKSERYRKEINRTIQRSIDAMMSACKPHGPKDKVFELIQECLQELGYTRMAETLTDTGLKPCARICAEGFLARMDGAYDFPSLAIPEVLEQEDYQAFKKYTRCIAVITPTFKFTEDFVS